MILIAPFNNHEMYIVHAIRGLLFGNVTLVYFKSYIDSRSIVKDERKLPTAQIYVQVRRHQAFRENAKKNF